jgi:Stage II sporulation protein
MIIRMLTIMLALATVISPLQAGMWDNFTSYFKKDSSQTPSVRVLIAMDQDSIQVEVDGPFKGYDPRTGETLIINKIGKNTTMQVIDAGLKWGEDFPGIHQLLIVPTDKSTRILVNGVEYPGSMYFYDVDRKLSVVNKIALESYLASVLTPTYQKREPEELLAAIAITARTNVYYLAENPKNPYWAIDGQQVGYRGIVDTSASPAINQAINDTKHMVLSKTGAYEGIVTPLYASWKSDPNSRQNHSRAAESKITVNEAKTMAETGANAAQILSKAFPQSSIQVTYHTPGTGR